MQVFCCPVVISQSCSKLTVASCPGLLALSQRAHMGKVSKLSVNLYTSIINSWWIDIYMYVHAIHTYIHTYIQICKHDFRLWPHAHTIVCLMLRCLAVEVLARVKQETVQEQYNTFCTIGCTVAIFYITNPDWITTLWHKDGWLTLRWLLHRWLYQATSKIFLCKGRWSLLCR